MASVNTNAAAITALRTLQNTNHSMDATQNRISTGYKIGEAKDNAAYWAISTTLKSDNKSLGTVRDALGLGASTVDTAYQGLNKAKDVLDEIKSKLTAATQDGVDRDTIQNEIKQLQDQLKSIATSSVFSGENWLSTDTSAVSYNANKQVVASFSRDPSGSVSIGTIGVDISKVALFDASTAAGTGGIVDGAVNLKGKDGRDLAIGGTGVVTGNSSKLGLDAAAGTVQGGVTAVGNNNRSVTVAAAAGTALAGTTGAAGGGAVPASLTLTGPLNIHHYAASDELLFQYKIDGDSSWNDVRIPLSGSGIGTSGSINASELAAKLTANGTFNAKATATVDGSGNLVIASRNAGNIAGTSTHVQTQSFVYNGSSGTTAAIGSGTGAASVSNAAAASNVPAIDKVIENTAAPASLTYNSGEHLTVYQSYDGGSNWTRITALGLDGVVANPGTMTVTDLYDQLGTAGNPLDGTDPSAPTMANPATNGGKLKFTAPAGSGSPNFQIKFTLSTGNGPTTLPDGSFTEINNSGLAAFNAFTTTTPGQAPSQATLVTTGAAAISGYGVTDYLSFEYSKDNGTTYTDVRISLAAGAGIATAGAITATELAAKLNANGTFNANLTASAPASGPNAGKLVITAANSTTYTLKTRSNVYAASTGTGAPVGAGVGGTSLTVAQTTGTGGSAATKGSVTATLNSLAGSVVAGDVITVKYSLDGVASQRDVTVTGGTFDAGAFVTAWGSLSGVAVTNPSGQSLKFESQTTGGTSNFTLLDATVRSSAATSSTVKNGDVFGGLTSSRAAAVRTDALTWGGGLAATDQATLNLSVDGTALGPITVAAGATLDDFVTNLNANATFAAKVTASKSISGELVLTSKTTGASSAVSITNVAFTDAGGAAKSVLSTNLGSVVSSATVSTAAFTSAITLDDDDNLYFNVQVDGATAPTNVAINKALINKALSTSPTPVTSGTIATAADFKKVVDAALAQANVRGVTTVVGTGADLNKLVFTSSTVGTNSKLTVSSVVASQGGNKISLENMDISAAALAKVGATTSDQIKQVLTAYIDAVNTAITKVTSAAASLGSVASRIDLQKSFVDTLMDTINKGVGNLIDADMSEESTKLQALQVKQQLGVQALSIANQASQSILSLFRG